MTIDTQEFPRLMMRLVTMAGLMGAALGILLSWRTGDAIGWSLLRISLLGAGFAWVTRHLCLFMLKGWIQSRLDALIAEQRAKDKAS